MKTRILLPLLLFALPVSALGQEDAVRAEERLYRAVKDGIPPAEVLALARDAVRRFPGRPYPLVILGDTLFRLRRLGSAVEAYRKALAAMGKEEREGRLGRQTRKNLALALREKESLEKGLLLERRARLAGWAVLALLAGAILFFSLPPREEGGKEEKREGRAGD